MRALVTGEIGFIGINLSHRLLREGHEVILFDNFRRAGVQRNLDWLRGQHRNRMHFIEGDVRDFNAVEKVMQGANVVFHLAAQVAVTTSIVNPRDDFSITKGAAASGLGEGTKRGVVWEAPAGSDQFFCLRTRRLYGIRRVAERISEANRTKSISHERRPNYGSPNT